MRPGEEHLDGPPIHGNTKLEVVWTAIPAIMLVLICSWAYVKLTDIEQAQAGEMRVNVTGQQFAWSYEYPQASGKPIKSTTLYLPKDRPVRFFVQARDVLHDFWVPAFRMKIDAVPGITTHYRVTPNRLGTYPVVCAELCGLGHSVMRSTAKVVSPADFNAWIKNGGSLTAPAARRRQAAARPAAAAPSPRPSTRRPSSTAPAAAAATRSPTPARNGAIGPNLDKVLVGKDAAFIKTSIENPSAEIAKGFQDIMPKTYADTLKPAELDALVTYLGKVAGK